MTTLIRSILLVVIFSTPEARLGAQAVLNLYGRRNVRAVAPRIDGRTLEVFDLFDTMFPRIPSAGPLLEF